MSRDLARSHDETVMWLYGKKPITVSYDPEMFGGHRHCGNGATMILVCHGISQDHVIKVPYDFIGGSSLW